MIKLNNTNKFMFTIYSSRHWEKYLTHLRYLSVVGSMYSHPSYEGLRNIKDINYFSMYLYCSAFFDYGFYARKKLFSLYAKYSKTACYTS